MDICGKIMYNSNVSDFIPIQFYFLRRLFLPMNLLKRAGAVLLAACTAVSLASCGENTANAMTVDGQDVRAGIYLYYATSAYGDAVETLRKGGETFEGAETSDDYKKILDKANIDNITAEEWIQNKAEKACKVFVNIEKEFDALGLKLSGEELAAADANAASSMNYYGDYFTGAGIGEETVKAIVLNSYKQDAVWQAYYGEGGSKGIETQELYDFYKANNLRAKYIEMPLKDGEGNLLKADGKKVIEEMANDYLKRLDKKKGNEAALMEEFDYLIEEHINYMTSISEAAITTTDENGSTITTPTTAKITTDKDGNTGTTEGEATTTAPVTTAPEDDEDKEEDGEDTAEVTTTTTATTETTTTTVGTYSHDNERILTVSTTAKEADGESEGDETTTEPSYTPCEKVYNWIADEKTQYLKPELIKDDECYYIVVKLDIEDRMTEDDLWNESRIESVRQQKYNQEFLDMIEKAAESLPATRNERAFKRYKVLDLDYLGYQQALMQSYYSMYGGGMS